MGHPVIVAARGVACPRTAGDTTYVDPRRRPPPGRARRRSRSPARGPYHLHMKHQAVPLRLPAPAQDVLLALLVAVMQVQGTVAKPADVGSRPLTDLGHLGYLLLIVSGLVLAVRRRWPAPVFVVAAAVMAAALGESVRSRRAEAAEALDRARRAERTREEEARSRVDAERLRIAREVHDTVAHAIAIINVQAGVTAYLLDKRPERAREALVTIEQTSAQTLHEMRAVLGVLRDSDNGRVPHPGLGQVNELTAVAHEAGLDIQLEVISAPRPLPSVVDHTAYRILQESITNVIRHAAP